MPNKLEELEEADALMRGFRALLRADPSGSHMLGDEKLDNSISDEDLKKKVYSFLGVEVMQASYRARLAKFLVASDSKPAGVVEAEKAAKEWVNTFKAKLTEVAKGKPYPLEEKLAIYDRLYYKELVPFLEGAKKKKTDFCYGGECELDSAGSAQ